MAIKKVKYGDTYIYVEDEIDYKETGVVCKEDELSKTKEIKIDKNDFEKTSTDLLGEKDEK